MAMKFKVGDRVRVISAGAVDWEAEDWISEDNLIVGGVYTVEAVWDTPSVTLIESRKKLHYHSDHFVLAETTQTLTAEDGTKHNAVGLSMVLTAVEEVVCDWHSTEHMRRELVEKLEKALCRLFAHAEDSDET